MKRKGQAYGLGSLLSVILIFVIAGLLAVFSLDIIEDQQDDLGVSGCGARTDGYTNYNATLNACYNGSNVHSVLSSSAAFNATGDTIEGVGKVPEKMPTLGNVVIAAIIIGVLLAAFGGFIAARSLR